MDRWVEYDNKFFNLNSIFQFEVEPELKSGNTVYGIYALMTSDESEDEFEGLALGNCESEQEAVSVVRDIIGGKYDMKTPPVRVEDVLEMWKQERKEMKGER